MKCKYCGFDSECDSLQSEGSPCGYKGCITYSCCAEHWKEHMLKSHNIDINKDDMEENKKISNISEI